MLIIHEKNNGPHPASQYKKLASITVVYLDVETMNIVNTQMYIDGVSGEAGQ